MSAPKHTKKKTYDPPRVSLGDTGGLAWQRGTGHTRSQSLPRADEPMQPLGTRPRATSMYPTPGSLVRRTSIVNIPPPRDGTPLRAPDFLSVATHPQKINKSGSRGPDSDSDEEGSGSDEDGATNVDSESQGESGDEDGGESEGDGESESEGDGEEDSSAAGEGTSLPAKQKNQNQNQSATRVRLKAGRTTPAPAASLPTEDRIMLIESLTSAERATAMSHTRSVALSLCGGKKQVKDLVNLNLPYKPNNEPEWVDKNGVISMHPDRSFEENMRGFGHLFDNAVTDVSRMCVYDIKGRLEGSHERDRRDSYQEEVIDITSIGEEVKHPPPQLVPGGLCSLVQDEFIPPLTVIPLSAMPSLEYPVTRQYPWRWTTVTVCFCAGFALVALGLFNFAAVGYNSQSAYYDDFKVSKGVEWGNKLNIGYTEGSSMSCDPSNIVLGGTYRTNNAIFALNVESLRDPMTSAPLGSANYSGDVLDSCRVNRIYMMAEYPTHEVKYRAQVACRSPSLFVNFTVDSIATIRAGVPNGIVNVDTLGKIEDEQSRPEAVATSLRPFQLVSQQRIGD
ncbi:unnamed protein product [Rhizoctonia solani]|uniref:Uncharacterized protein n=1 Tax=Rhizoctonia solani TaxID=456999 RepID=A0A8H3DW71_9AGAM|nr:unnamed protein product [Rhizoctonia solani]